MGDKKDPFAGNLSGKRREEKQAKWKKAGISLLALALIFACAGVLYATKRVDSNSPVLEENASGTTNPQEVVEANVKTKDYWTMAIFGVDSPRVSNQYGTSDVILLCTINKKNGDMRLTSVHRDALIKQPGEDQAFQKIGQSFRSGSQSAVKALNENLDLAVDGYLTFSLQAAAEAVNLMGGIELEITEEEAVEINAFLTESAAAAGISPKKLSGSGNRLLDGEQTLAYWRLSLMDTEFKGTKGRLQAADQLLEKLKNADHSLLEQIMEVFLPQTEISIEEEDLAFLEPVLENHGVVGTAGFPFHYEKTHIFSLNGDFVLPVTLESNVVSLHQLLYQDENFEASSTVKEISRELQQLDGKRIPPDITE